MRVLKQRKTAGQRLTKRHAENAARTKRVKAHDEENTAKTGDTVRIMETRPLSKDKRWRLVEIVERAR